MNESNVSPAPKTEQSEAVIQTKYDKPKIILIDVDRKSQAALKAEGYNVAVGSFGSLYKVEKGDGYVPVIVKATLPNHAEQEIIIIDLSPAKALEGPDGEKHTSDGTDDWWAKASHGIVDPRPRSMAAVQDDFDVILKHGGIFIVFAESRYAQALTFASLSKTYGLITTSDISFDNWSFLPCCQPGYLNISDHQGREMFVESSTSLHTLLTRHLRGAEYLCTFQPRGVLASWWTDLIKNKFHETVSGIIQPSSDSGCVLIFPQIKNKDQFLVQLLSEVLPEIVPSLFPHVEGGQWVHRTEYEIPRVLDLKNQITEIEAETNERVRNLEAVIDEERATSDYLYDLVRQTGAPLVVAVKRALEALGFRDIVDADEENNANQDKGFLREDLRIRDKSPLVLVEVKGISNLPKESESLQVWKYLAPAMKKLNRTDIRGLAIINHQKNLPPLERENDKTFTPDIVTNAETQDFGLLTTWDLYKLIRSFVKNGWQHEQVESLFYKNGRIEPIPIHYEHLGTIQHFWEDIGVVAVDVEHGTISKGDRISFELMTHFQEQISESLQMDNGSVDHASVGQRVAIKTILSKQEARDGVRVFRVNYI